MPILHLDKQVLSDARLSDAEIAIQQLDGADRSLVIVEIPDGRTLMIGGGPRYFVVECAENETDRWCVVNPISSEDSIDIVVGGSLVDYPARVCVDLKAALEAVRVFIAEDGCRSPLLVWSVET